MKNDDSLGRHVDERTYHADRAVLFNYQHLLGTTG